MAGLPVRLLTALLLLAAFAATAAADPLISKVHPAWSPFMTVPVADPTGLIGEARRLMTTDPARVSDILRSTVNSADPRQKAIVLGLLADALYQRGGNSLFEAARGYRAMLLDNPEPAFQPWLNFMDGNVKKILGFTGESRLAYEEALKAGEVPWRSAIVFNMAALELEVGNNSAAIRTLDEWLTRWRGKKGTALALFMLAEAFANLKDERPALAAYDEAAKLEPEAWLVRPQIGYRLSELLQASGREEEAARELEKIGGKAPGSEEGAKSRLATGEMWVQKGNIPLAARAYAQLVDEKPTPDQLEEALLRLALLGVLYSDEVELTEPFPAFKEFYRPRERFEEVLAKSKNDERRQLAEYGLGEVEKKDGNREMSISHLIKAFKNYPETPMTGRAYDKFMEVLETTMAAAVARGDYAEALKYFEEYRETARWSPQRDLGLIYFNAGRAHIGMGETTKGISLLNDALLMNTSLVDHAVIREELLRARIVERDPQAVAEWVSAHPEDREARLLLARMKAGSGEAEAARQHYAEVLKTEPDPLRRIEVGRESEKLSASDVEGSLKTIEERRKLLAALPPTAANREELQEAHLHYAAGRQAKAAAILETIPDLVPEDRYILGMCYVALGEGERARPIFEEILKGRPDSLTMDLVKFQLSMIDLEKKEGGAVPELREAAARRAGEAKKEEAARLAEEKKAAKKPGAAKSSVTGAKASNKSPEGRGK